MRSFLIHERMVCEVTFVKRVVADSPGDALDASSEGDSELLGVVIGDNVSGGTCDEAYDDIPAHIPYGLYPEGSRT
jgi:hypothetical protein